MFPRHPKCSPAPLAVPEGFFNSAPECVITLSPNWFDSSSQEGASWHTAAAGTLQVLHVRSALYRVVLPSGMSMNIRIFEYSNILGLEYIFVFGFITFYTFEYIRIFARSSEYIRIFFLIFFVVFLRGKRANRQQVQVHDQN